jgi:hypothetical protein
MALTALAGGVVLPSQVQAAGGQAAAQAAPATTCPENEAAPFHACASAMARAFEPPRTPDGKPDMQGWWQSALGGTQNIEEHARTPATNAGKSLIVDPPTGLIPYLPAAAAQIKENIKKYIEPNAACFPSGAPRSIYTPGGFQIRQSPGYVVMLLDRAHNYRIVPTDGRPHLRSGLTLWQGDSRGRWDGNTLVVDVANQNAKSWLDQQGRYGTTALHVVERYTFVDIDTIHFEATLEDPNVYARPWTMALPLKRDKRKARLEFVQDECFEGDETAQMLLDLGYRIFSGLPPGSLR